MFIPPFPISNCNVVVGFDLLTHCKYNMWKCHEPSILCPVISDKTHVTDLYISVSYT